MDGKLLGILLLTPLVVCVGRADESNGPLGTPEGDPGVKNDKGIQSIEVQFPLKGWFQASNRRFYRFFGHEKINYNTAKSRCELFGARLAAAGMRKPGLRNEIKRRMPRPIPNTWIGLDDLGRQGRYVWSDGVRSTRSNTNWGPRQPHMKIERCAVLYGPDNGRVHDDKCWFKRNYLCEL